VGGGGGVGLGAGGGGMGLGEGGWSIAGRRGGMLFCWFSLTVKKNFYFIVSFLFETFSLSRSHFQFIFVFLERWGGGGPLRGRALV